MGSAKRVLIACGAAAATSTVVARLLSRELSARGIEVEMEQCAADETEEMALNFDLVVSTNDFAMIGSVPVVSSLPFLTGEGVEATIQEIVTQLGG